MGGNNELQIYTDRPENVRVENHHLVIEARRGQSAVCGTVREFSSGRVRTKHQWRPLERLQQFCDDFHVFALEWTEKHMRWFVDDHCYGEADASEWHSQAAPSPAPFDQRFHLIFNIAVGGNLPGNPNHTTVFPQQMLIDYVRVYQ